MPRFARTVLIVVASGFLASVSTGQRISDRVPLSNWAAPAFWSPSPGQALRERPADNLGELAIESAKAPAVATLPAFPFTAIAPCRQYNSLNSTPLPQGVNRAVLLTGAPCGIPAGAAAVSANITIFNITGATGNGVFKVDTVTPPAVAWINYPPTEAQRGNAGVVALNVSGQIIVQVAQGAGQVDFVVDVNGYFAPNTALFRNIAAITCTATGGAPSGDSSACGGGGTVRTDGSNLFPCIVRARTTLDTYICDLNLPGGAIIQEIIAYGNDVAPDGYMEAAVWRTANDTFVPSYLSSGYGGNWQSTGVGPTPGITSFPIFQTSDIPHVVDGNSRYTIGFGLKSGSPLGSGGLGFRVKYVLP